MSIRNRKIKNVSYAISLIFSVPLSCVYVNADEESGADEATPSTRPTLEEILVTADRRDSYSADYIQAGGFRAARLLDTPSTVSVLTKELLEAQQAQNISDATRNTAGVTASQINTVIYSNLSIRGIPVGNLTNYRLNGVLPLANYIDMPLENKARIEVLKGASGLFYGFAAPSGVVNLVSERPTEDGLEVEVNGNSHGGYGGAIDISKRWENTGLRFNAGGGELETGLDNFTGDKHFLSLAYDWDVTENFSIQLDGEYIDRQVTEPTQFYLLTADGGVELPPLQRLETNMGGEWFLAAGEETNILAKARYKFTDSWELSLGVGRSKWEGTRRYSSFYSYDIETGDGFLGLSTFPKIEYENTIYRLDLAGAFATGDLTHQIVLGVSDYTSESIRPARVRQFTGPQNFRDPVNIPEQATPDRVVLNETKSSDLGYYITDRIDFNEKLQLTLGYRWTEYTNESQLAPKYEDDPGVVSGSLLYKLQDNLSLYASYLEGLEEGGTASGIADNAGEVLPAAVSEQMEMGIKYKTDEGLNVTLAYFDIERQSAFISPVTNLFKQDGLAVYQGFELSANGELTDTLSIAASATYIDAEQETAGDEVVIGKRIENTPELTGSLFLEYRLPQLPGLSLNGGAFYVGDRAVNPSNDTFVPGYVLFDLGASYVTNVFGGKRLKLHVNAHNVGNKRYWQATGARLAAAGLPRSVSVSATMSF